MISGVDEAGRGPVLGPMVMAIVTLTKTQEKKLKQLGVKDSKLLTEKRREELFKVIKKFPNKIIKVKTEVIDKHVKSKTSSLNVLEAITTTKLINSQKTKHVIVDLPAKNKTTYVNHIKAKLKTKPKIQAEFKADLNYVVVAAASILAKVTRDREIKKLKKLLKIETGSGYPSDPYTQKALKKHFKLLKPYLRHSWKTFQVIEEKRIQTSLSSY